MPLYYLELSRAKEGVYYHIYDKKTRKLILEDVTLIGQEETDLSIGLHIVDDLSDYTYFCVRHYYFVNKSGAEKKLSIDTHTICGSAEHTNYFLIIATL